MPIKLGSLATIRSIADDERERLLGIVVKREDAGISWNKQYQYLPNQEQQVSS